MFYQYNILFPQCIDDSNQPEFRYFIQQLSVSYLQQIAQFFGFTDEGLAIEKKFCAVTSMQQRILLRVLRIPNCRTEIREVIDCLAECCNIHYDYRGMLLHVQILYL